MLSAALASRLNIVHQIGGEIGEANGVGVEDGDVAAGLIGDVDFVALIDQANEGAAHADDVVIGMRARR